MLESPIFSTILLLQETAPTIPWWVVVGGIATAVVGIIGIPTAILGLWGARLTNQKTQLETRKLQLEILEKMGVHPPVTDHAIERQYLVQSPQAGALGVQDFVIRFIILYLALFLWGSSPA